MGCKYMGPISREPVYGCPYMGAHIWAPYMGAIYGGPIFGGPIYGRAHIWGRSRGRGRGRGCGHMYNTFVLRVNFRHKSKRETAICK